MSTYDAIDENVENEKSDEKNRHLCETIKKENLLRMLCLLLQAPLNLLVQRVDLKIRMRRDEL